MPNSFKKITKQIVKSLKPYRPEKIFLFGSSASGKSKKDSDIDLLIIKKTTKPHFKRIPEARLRLWEINKAFDILVMTPEDIKKRLNLGDFFIEEILRKGKLLYEAKK